MASETREYRGKRVVSYNGVVPPLSLSLLIPRRSPSSPVWRGSRDKSAGRFSRRIHRVSYPTPLPRLPFSLSLLVSSLAVGATAHTLRSIYLKQMLSDAAPLCGGKMRPTLHPFALSLLFPRSPSSPAMLLSSLSLPPNSIPTILLSYLYPPSSLSSSTSILFRPPLSFNQGCFLRVPSASCSLHPTPSLPSSILLSTRVAEIARTEGARITDIADSTDLIDTQSLENRRPVFFPFFLSFFFRNRESTEIISSDGNGERMTGG